MKLAKREQRETRRLAPMSRGWSPFRQLSRLHDEIDRLFEEPFGGWLPPSTPLFEGWSPAVDVYEQLKETFSSMLAEARSLQGRYSGDLAQKARQVNVSELLPLVRTP